jgi:hypothetical protein
VHAVGAQLREVALRRRMQPHGRVHRGRDENGRVRGQVSGRQKIIGDAVGELGEDVGGGGRDEQ